ncbi:hypothetical protein G6F57_014002 [Rhizopus arrhizus]|nr:hypothetical protein G6F57_014002 [Rhizopus arrhizus]
MTQVAGLGDAQRLYRLQSEAFTGCTVERWRGRDALGEHAWTEVEVLCTDAGLELGALPATRATLITQRADGGQWQRSGLVADAARVGGDGGLVRYRLHLVSWTWWLQHARHSRVFQEQGIRAIVDAVLSAHADIARWRWAEGVDAFLDERVRSYCVQYRESDLDFLQRLLAEEGLGWRLYPDEEAPCGNGLEIFADSVALPEDATSAGAGVRFHRRDPTEPCDSVPPSGRHRSLASTTVSLQSDDYRQVRALSGQSPMEGGGNGSTREDFDAVGAYAFSDGAAASRQARLQAQAREAISGKVVPAFQQLRTFFVSEYVPQARTTLAAEAMPDGKAYYKQQIHEYTTLDLSPDEIHRIGLGEVARIQGEMNDIIRQVKFKGSFAEFLTFLRTDPQFYAKTPEELLSRAAWISKRADGQLGKYMTLPRARFTIVPVPPDIAPFWTAGRGGMGTYWLNTYNLPSRPLYNLPALTLHESDPGHALQGAIAAEQKNLPEFRRNAYISAYGEGWALYCEKLGVEMGIYETPYEDFGRLTYEMWRAARLVIDTGVHSKGWTP